MSAIQKFMQDHYTDERLAALLAHAQDGKLSFTSCCCFIGTSTANHSLQGTQTLFELLPWNPGVYHLLEARQLGGAREAEEAFFALADGGPDFNFNDGQRRMRLIPLIIEEMDRREKLRGVIQPTSELVAV